MSPMPQRSIVERMFGAAMLSAPTYEEVEHDRGATGQAFVVVVLGAIAAAIGVGLFRGGFLAMLFGGALSAVLGWLAWSSVTLLVGTRLFGGRADYGQMLRAIGFAHTPKIALVLCIVPGVGLIVGPLVMVWTLVAGVVAIRQALDLDVGKALLTALVGWLVMWTVGIIFSMMFGIAAFGASMFR